jgi:predicted nucleic acid-binding protein
MTGVNCACPGGTICKIAPPSFIDWELILPQNVERELKETIRKENKEMGKPYISSWERIAIQRTLRVDIIKVAERLPVAV